MVMMIMTRMMKMKLRVTIDTDECDFDSMNESSYTNGVVGIDYEGVAHWWYQSPSYFVPFKDVEILECNHSVGTRKVREHDAEYGEEHDECLDCGKNMSEVCNP